MKKTLGILFIVIACILSLLCILVFFTTTRPELSSFGARMSNEDRLAMVVGFCAIEAIFAIPAFLLFFFGFKWATEPKNKPIPAFNSRILQKQPTNDNLSV